MAHFVDGAVNGVAGGVDFVRAVHEFVAGLIDFHQARSGDLMKHQAKRIDQEIFGAGHLGRDMREDQIVPAVQRDQTVTGGKIDTGLPLGSADLIFDVR